MVLEGTDITLLSDTRQTLYRRDQVGIIFQFFNLIPTLTVLENITLPKELGGAGRKATVIRARELLGRVGLGGHAPTLFPTSLAVGSSSGSPLLARSCMSRSWSSLMSQLATSMKKPGADVLELLLSLTCRA